MCLYTEYNHALRRKHDHDCAVVSRGIGGGVQRGFVEYTYKHTYDHHIPKYFVCVYIHRAITRSEENMTAWL